MNNSLAPRIGATVLLTVCSIFAFAQGYNTAVGLRVGRAGGLSAAQRIGKHSSLEAYFTTGLFDEGSTVTLMGRQHLPLIIKRVNLFVGGGVHKGWNYVEETSTDKVKRGNPFGFDGQVGAEATFGRTNVALDYNVQLNLSGSLSPIRPPGMAITVRYVIDKRESNLKLNLPDFKESSDEKKAREKRKKQRAKERKRKAKGEKPTFLERLGLDSSKA